MKLNPIYEKTVGIGIDTNLQQKVEVASNKFGLNALEKMALTALVAMFGTHANAADFTLDVSSILTGISTLVTLVTSIGLAFLSVVLVIKAFKYIKAAM